MAGRADKLLALYIYGSSEEFVGESVGVNPPTSRGDSPMRPSENQHKNLAKKEEQEAFCRPPAGRGRAGCVRRRLNKNLPELAPVPGKTISCSGRGSVAGSEVISEGTPVASQPPPPKWPLERGAA